MCTHAHHEREARSPLSHSHTIATTSRRPLTATFFGVLGGGSHPLSMQGGEKNNLRQPPKKKWLSEVGDCYGQGPGSSQGFDDLLCNLCLSFRHFYSKWDLKNIVDQILGGGGCCAPSKSATVYHDFCSDGSQFLTTSYSLTKKSSE